MSELTLLLIRLAFLAVLWFFVIAAVGVIRTDLFGSRTSPATRGKPAKPAKPAAKPKSKKGEPRQLVVTGGPLQGTIINLSETPITIGRANDATLVVTDDYASSRHARLFPPGRSVDRGRSWLHQRHVPRPLKSHPPDPGAARCSDPRRQDSH
ncbi:antibiotic biosynthesis regulator FhaB [Nonomuraea dietziae]